jgi:hypothetical protein
MEGKNIEGTPSPLCMSNLFVMWSPNGFVDFECIGGATPPLKKYEVF